jgi:hypothetical protein
LREYKALVLKMNQEFGVNNQMGNNMELFCDLEVMLGFSCFMPRLNELIKFSKSWQCFMCDFVFAIKLCQLDLYC